MTTTQALACTHCGSTLPEISRFCPSCGTATGASPGQAPSAPSFQTQEGRNISFQGMSDEITRRFGLEKIEAFSVTEFFSQVLKKHDPDEVENIFSVGTPSTTPPLDASMGNLPNPWIFFRVLASTLLTYLVFYFGWEWFSNPNLIPGLIIVGSFAVPFSVIVLFFELNTPRNVSMMRVIQMVVAGGAISLIISLFLFTVTPMLGFLGAPAAGLVEECGKLCAVLLALRMVPSARYPYKLNGLLFGAAVGAGFAAFESAGYALRFGLQAGSDAMLDIITIRGAMAPFAHIVWTAITASTYLSVRKDKASFGETISDRRFYSLFLVSVGLHFIWNMPFQGPFWIKFWVLGFVAWVVVISLVQSGLKEIGSKVEGATAAS